MFQSFYPQQIQKQLMKKKSLSNEKVISNIKNPGFQPYNDQTASQINQESQDTIKLKKINVSKDKKIKNLNKIKLLSKFQSSMMQTVLQKIDRTIKPIKKNCQLVTKSLEEKNIFLDQENFDILKLLQQKNPAQKCKDKKRDSVADGEKTNSRRNLGKRPKGDLGNELSMRPTKFQKQKETPKTESSRQKVNF